VKTQSVAAEDLGTSAGFRRGRDRVEHAPRELDALELLIRRTDKIVPKRLFEDTIYGANEEIAGNTIEAIVSRLRRRLQAINARVTIHTLRGVGYSLTE